MDASKTALITGATGGIGAALCAVLRRCGYAVVAVGRSRPAHCDGFFPADLRRPAQAEDAARKAAAAHKDLHAFVYCAGTAHFGPHDGLSAAQLEEMTAVNLTSPMAMAGRLAAVLRSNGGRAVFIGSQAGVTPRRLGAAYGATKAGLHHFARALFDEVRGQGVAVTTLCPDLTARTGLYDGASFAPGPEADAHIEPECVAHALACVLTARPGTVVTHVDVVPQRLGVAKRPKP